MKKIFTPPILLMLLFAGNLRAQVNVQNNGVLFLTTTSDTLFVNGNFTNSSTASLSNNANIFVKQDILNDQASLPAGSGTLYLNGTVLQNVLGAQRLNTNNFVINNTNGVALGNDVSVYNTFTLSKGNFALNNNNVTLLSNINNTSNVAPVVGSVTYGTGKFIVERYIKPQHAWRLLTAPISTTTQTINNGWQEGQTSGNSNPSYGTQITGGSVANGFDQGINLNAGIKQFTGSGWAALPNTNATLITNQPGYMVFVRGDRSTILSQGVNAVLSATVLRTSGQLKTGDQTFTVPATGFALIGNPYASPIDFHQLTKTNVKDVLYLWDPKLTGTGGVGAFVTLTWGGSSYSVVPSSGGSNLTQYIQSGAAFFVASINGTSSGTLVIKETDKSSVASMNANRGATSTASLNSNLYSINSDSTISIVDGILNGYAVMYSNNIDEYDAAKLNNFSESLSSQRDGLLLVAERRQPVNSSDTIFLNMLHMKVKSYQFEFVADNFSNNGLIGYLEDSYLNTSSTIDLRGTTTFNFNVINVPGSWNPNRFRIVFKQATILPVTFGAARAFAQNKNIEVEWKIENETNIKQYDIERSADGRQFVNVKTVAAKGNSNSTSSYNWLDETAFKGHNYYRIKSTGINEEVNYSSVMKVDIGNTKPELALETNIITNNVVAIRMNNMPKGIYSVSIVNKLAQVMLTKKIEHEDGSSEENIPLNKNFAPGIYHLIIIKPNFTSLTMKLLIE